jgi:MtfA peptidase
MGGTWVILFIFICLAILALMFNVISRYSEQTSSSDNNKPKSKPPNAEFEPLLTRYFPFYNSLDDRLKKKFRKRLAWFLRIHSFEGREGFIITDEVMILISAAAINLTLGLKDYKFRDFEKIIVYPGIFFSPFTHTHNKGETNPHGMIVFSWTHLKEGFSTTTDHINLGYHEFAHALLLQESNEGVNDSMFHWGYRRFSNSLLHEHLSQQVKELDIYREYAFTNKMEFFAVSAESFMEAPEFLYEKCPRMYDLMCRILRQDPVHKEFGLRYFYSVEEFRDYGETY